MTGEHDTTDRPRAAGGAALQVNCPHCRSPIDTVADGADDDVLCPSCGSNFRVDRDQTQSWGRATKVPQLDKFELLEAVGRGAFGTVYRARDKQLDRAVAVKVPRAGQLSTQEDEDRFVREARNAAQLQHPGIVPVYEVGRSDEFPYIVSEYVEGITLADALTGRRFTFRESAQLVAQVAAALEHAHSQGVVHRDLKPSNIMLTADDRPRVMDFGLAKRDAGEVTMTMEGQVLGTPAYMSPEQASGQAHHVDGRSDIYTLGCVLYEMVSGELPFRGNQRMLLHQVLNDEPRALRSLNDRIPRDLETICLKAMAKEPSRRYQTAQAMGDDLARYLNGEPIAARPVGRIERSWRWCRRNPVVAGLSAAVFLALTTGALVSGYFAVQAESRAEEAIAEKTRADDKAAEAARASAMAIEEAHKAIVEAEKATSVSQFLAGMFETSAPLKKGGVRFTGFGLGSKKGKSAADLTAREILDRGAHKVVEELQDQPAVRAALLETIGNVYIGLSLPEQADPLLTESLAIRRRLHPEPHVDTAAILHSLAVLRTLQLRFDESETAAREALAMRQKLLGDDHQDTVDTKFVLAFAIGTQGVRLPEAEPLMRDVLAWRRAHLGNQDSETVFGMLGLAGVLVQMGELEKGAPLLSEATALLLKDPETKPLGLAVTETIQSIFMGRLKNWNTAADAGGKAVKHFLEFESEDHPAFTLIANQYLRSLDAADRKDEIKQFCRAEFEKIRERGGRFRLISKLCVESFYRGAIASGNPDDLDEAERICRELLQTTRDSAARFDRVIFSYFLASLLAAKATIACDRNELDQAQGLCREARELNKANLAVQRELTSKERLRYVNGIAMLVSQLGTVLSRLGKTDEAEALYRETLPLAAEYEDAQFSVRLTYELANLKQSQGEVGEAERLFRESLRLTGKLGGSDPMYQKGWERAVLCRLAWCVGKQGRWEEEQGFLQQAIECDQRAADPYNSLAWLRATCPEAKYRNGAEAVELATKACELSAWKLANDIDTLAAAYAEQGNFAEAIRWQTKAIELNTNEPAQQDGRTRLVLYQANQPFREKARAAAP